jgi:hypothetical protein
VLLSLVILAGCDRTGFSLVGLWPNQEKSGAYGTGSWTGHATPKRVLQSNLRLLYGNHQEISDL